MTYIHNTPWALYNEINEYAADWLENLIRLGKIAPGVVYRRSISDIRPDELRGFRQCHFFAGIGVWSYSLRRSGWPDDAAVWTGSCPCQPFSNAGKGGGVDDERHLWPDWFHLIRECQPDVVYGEQVASKDGLGWLDLVLSDLEAEGYAAAALDTCSAGSGAPHLRQRLRICAYNLRSASSSMGHGIQSGLEGHGRDGRGSDQPGWIRAIEARSTTSASPTRGLGNPDGRYTGTEWIQRGGQQRLHAEDGEFAGELADRDSEGRGRGSLIQSDREADQGECRDEHERLGATYLLGDEQRDRRRERGHRDHGRHDWPQLAADGTDVRRVHGAAVWPGPTNGFWRDADWLLCRDGTWRPVEPGTFPLVDGSAFRVGSGSTFEGKSRQEMLRGYGNAIDAEATVDFLHASYDALRSCASKLSGQSPLELVKVRRRESENLA